MTKKDQDRIRKAFENKQWPDIKSSDSWNIFKVMSEFVDGYDKLARIGPCVSIFGSARTKPGHPYYECGVEIAERLAEAADRGLWRPRRNATRADLAALIGVREGATR